MARFCLRCLGLAFLCLLICISGHGAKGQEGTNSTTTADAAPNNQTTDDMTSASDTGVDGTTTTTAGPISDNPGNGTNTTEPITTSEQGSAVPDNTTSETSATDAPPAVAGETGPSANRSSPEVPTGPTSASPPPTSDDKENSTSSAEPATVDTVTNETATRENVTTSPVENVTSQETRSQPAETTGATDTAEVTSVSEQTTSTATKGTTTSEPGTTSVQTPAGETTASHSQDEDPEAEANFVIKDENNNPCLLASLDFTIRVLYINQQGQNQTYEASLPDPRDVTVTGSCGENSSSLKLTWNHTTFALNLIFVLSGPGNRSSGDDASSDVPENTKSSWSLRQISLTFDTSDISVFPGASDDTGVDGTTTTTAGPISDNPGNGTNTTEPITTSEQGSAVPDNTTSETSATDAPPAVAGETGPSANRSSPEVPTGPTSASPPPTSDDKENSTSSAEPATVDTVTNETATRENVTTSPVENVTSQETRSQPAETTGATDTAEVTSVSEQTTSTATKGTTTSEPGTTSVQTPAGETTASHSQDEDPEAEANFVIKDENNNPCLLASLDFTIRVLYINQQGQNQTYEASLPDPRDVTVTGSCGENSSSLKLTWNHTTFALNLIFVLSGPGNRSSGDDASSDVPENTKSSWSLRQISLTFDTSDISVFPGASDGKLQTASVGDLNLFSTPLGQSYMCQEAQLLSIELQEARLNFNWVHLMPFGVNGTRFSAETENCLTGGASESAPGQQDAYLIPLIVACSLAALVVIIVLGYAISRCVTRHQRQSEYKQMP